ncbi:uncharacterized protein PAE49_006138 isoform 3-T3 [Odontesthes bonariensis]
MSSVQHLREFISQRLTAAAEEIFSEFEKTIVQYEEEIGRQRRLLDISWKPQINFHRVELPQYYLCEEEIPVNLEKDSSLDQEEPEPPQIKEEPVEVCTSHEEQQLLLKQETDNPTVTLTYEESDLSEAEPTNVQLQDQSQDQEGSGRESTGNAELRPKKRRHSNDGDNSSMSESPRNTAKDLSQQYVCEEKEKILTDQQFFNHESNSSLDQQEPEPPQFKEELEERCTSQEEEWLELKQETDILSVTPTYEESELTSEQLLSQNSSVAERQEMEKNLRDEESESTQNSKLKPHKRRGRNINHSNDVINESQFNADTGDQAVKCEVCGKAFMSYSELTAHSGMHTELPQYYLCEEEIPVNLEKDSSLDQEEPEPPQIKEEQVEVCTSHEEQQLLLKQETDNLTVTLTNEESDRSEAEPTNVQLQDQSQDQEGSGRESTGNAEPRPKKRRHSNDGDNSSMSESHRNTAKDLSQQYVCEEEILTDQQFFNHESNSSLDQQEPEPPQFKEELEERCTSQEEEGLELKQETDILYVTPTYEESELTSDQLLSQNSSVAERQEMEKNLRDEESESTQNAKLKPNKRRGRSINHSNDVINESQFNADTGDQAVKCEVCGKGFMSYSELRAHYGMHTGEKPFSCSVVNAWLLYKRHCQALKMPKKEIINMRKFQAQVASSLILVNTTPKTPKRGRPSSNPDAAGSPLNAGKRPSPGDGSPKCPSSKKACTHPPQDVRNDQTGHFPMKIMMADDGCSLKNPSRRRVRMKPQHDAEKHIRLKTDKEGLRQVFVNSYKGRGIFASIPFSKGDFVLEYRGKLLTPDNPPVVETYSETEATYLFDFQWKGKSWCLDASLEDQSLGRLVNDQHKAPTCKMRTIQVDGMPHLCLFALRDIVPGEEITYNYGESDWPWRKQISTSPVAAPSTGDDTNSSLQLLVPAEHVQHLSSNVNTVSTSRVAAPSTGDDSNSSLQLLVPAEHVQHLSSNVNTSKEDTSDESMDESSHSDYNDVDYIPDTDGTNSDVSMSLSPDKPRQRLQVSHMIPVMANNPDKESSSTDSPDKESSTKRNAVRKKMGSSFIPGKKKKRTVSLQERRNTSRHPEKGSSAIVSPEKDKGSIEVPRTTSTQERRVYDKRSYCLYCSKPTAKISRHLQTVHRNKPDVAKALFYPQNSKERRVRLAVLRNRGNFSHNTDVVREGRGDLVARYRTKDIRNGKDFIHCIHCQGLYSKKTLWKHIKTCNEKPGEDEPRVGRKRVRSLCALTTPVSCEISEGL